MMIALEVKRSNDRNYLKVMNYHTLCQPSNLTSFTPSFIFNWANGTTWKWSDVLPPMSHVDTVDWL